MSNFQTSPILISGGHTGQGAIEYNSGYELARKEHLFKPENKCGIAIGHFAGIGPPSKYEQGYRFGELVNQTDHRIIKDKVASLIYSKTDMITSNIISKKCFSGSDSIKPNGDFKFSKTIYLHEDGNFVVTVAPIHYSTSDGSDYPILMVSKVENNQFTVHNMSDTCCDFNWIAIEN